MNNIEERIKKVIATNNENVQKNAEAQGELKSLKEQQQNILIDVGVGSEQELYNLEQSLSVELEKIVSDIEKIQNPELNTFEENLGIGNSEAFGFPSL